MSDTALTIKGLDFKFGERPIFSDLTLSQKKGEWLSLIGINGAGKTTLGLIIKGILLPSKGEIAMFAGDPEQDRLQRKKRVGLLFSNPRDQICSTTVLADISFGLLNQGFSLKEAAEKSLKALDIFKIGHLAHHSTHRLSGAQQQKVALTGLIALQPEFLILDEPASFLCRAEREEFLSLVKKLQQQGISILYIATNWEEVSMADRVAILEQGSITWDGPPHALLSQRDILGRAGFCTPDLFLLAERLGSIGVKIPEGHYSPGQMAITIVKLLRAMQV